jgi:hypothetical protein
MLRNAYGTLISGEEVAEDEAASRELEGQTVITVPDNLLPVIHQLIADSKNA